MQELFRRHNLRQRDLTRALKKHQPPISRTYAHYIWHGKKPLSLNAVLAIHEAFPTIPERELFEALRDSRHPPDPPAAAGPAPEVP